MFIEWQGYVLNTNHIISVCASKSQTMGSVGQDCIKIVCLSNSVTEVCGTKEQVLQELRVLKSKLLSAAQEKQV